MRNTKWCKTNTSNFDIFYDLEKLISLKKEKNYTIAFVVPTLNEEKTIGKVVSVLSKEQKIGIIDEVFVIDSNSTDNTIEEARKHGAKVFLADEIKPNDQKFTGKGENLWKSLLVTNADLIFWVDGDITNFSNRFVYGLIGPILTNKDIKFVKSMYRRPLIDNKYEIENGGGRLTELLIKPLLKEYFEDLLCFNQPLSGEYGGFREIFTEIDFPIGYGVEIGLLIDIYKNHGLSSMFQVDMGERKHRNRDLSYLSEMAKNITPIFFDRCKKYGVYKKNSIKIIQRPSIK